jgi:hypothetical protein
MANIVARRCSVLDRAEDRELIWHLQWLSHREGGLKRFTRALVEKFPDRIGTPSMRRFGMNPGKIYTAKQVKAIREEIGAGGPELSLRGDEPSEWMIDRDFKMGRDCGDERPISYPIEDILDPQKLTDETLPELLEELCLNPARRIEDCRPWYFSELIRSLREHFQATARELQAKTVVTEIGDKLGDALDYAVETRCMVLVDGLARTGKTFAAQAWCAQRPGSARYVQVPSTNDDIGFFRAIAKAIGVSINTNSKAQELRQRIEDALQPGNLAIVFDEAHWAFPISGYRDALPTRLLWILTALVNYRVPVGLIATPQFIRSQKAVEHKSHWESAQLIGRIGHYEKLPDTLDRSDLSAVAKSLLPEGDARSVAALVDFAEASAKYLAGIESAVRRARYVASRDGRQKVTSADIRHAIKSGVIPSDTALATALADRQKPRRRNFNRPLNADLNAPSEAEETRPSRATNFADEPPALPTDRQRIIAQDRTRDLVTS